MKLRIVSDGSPFGTRVEDAETGELVENVFAVTFYHDARTLPGCVPSATITLARVEVDLVGERL